MKITSAYGTVCVCRGEGSRWVGKNKPAYTHTRLNYVSIHLGLRSEADVIEHTRIKHWETLQ
jgi:hypothetical protein